MFDRCYKKCYMSHKFIDVPLGLNFSKHGFVTFEYNNQCRMVKLACACLGFISSC